MGILNGLLGRPAGAGAPSNRDLIDFDAVDTQCPIDIVSRPYDAPLPSVWASLLGNVLLFGLGLLLFGLMLPQTLHMPVQGASPKDWNGQSFWAEPWGTSGTHKGIDIFAPAGKPVLAAVSGLRLYQGQWGDGGQVVVILGPKWRLHYYAHLSDAPAQHVNVPWWVSRGTPLGSVGTTGNAQGKPAHLHYSVVSLLPLPWNFSLGSQGWKRMFYLNPGDMLAQDWALLNPAQTR